MPYQMVVDKLRARYNTPHREFYLQFEADSLSFDEFMTRNQIQDVEKCLRGIAEYLNNITPELVDGFRTESHKIRYLRDAVLDKKQETTL